MFSSGAALISLGSFALAGPKKASNTPEKPPYPFPSRPGEPDIYAKTAVVMDAQSGRVLWCREPEKRMFPASTTKILTTLLLLEQTHPDDVIVAPEDIKTVGEASLHLEPGEQLTAHHMALAMMVRSANDACYAVAKQLGGSLPAFADEMNARAQRIGCRNTHFVNPNGLHHPDHYTCALDLARIAREAMRNPEFRTLAKTPKVEIERSKNQQDRWLISKNHQLTKDLSCVGIKTGYTKPAGPCFVGAVDRNGWEVVTVVMNTIDWQADHRALADWAFQHFEPVRAVHAGQEFKIGEMKASVAEPVEVAVRKGQREAVTFQTEATRDADSTEIGARVGDLVTLVDGKPVNRSPLLLRERAPIKLGLVRGPSAETWPNWALFGGAAGLSLLVLRSVRGR